jgi:CHAT domain-containing protein
MMSDFYSRWVKSPAEGKAEALRQAQLAFIRGAANSQDGHTDRGLVVTEAGKKAQQPHPTAFTHPFYWAPFVLIGNFQ